MHAIVDFLMENFMFTVIGATYLIQISPIKINPWTYLLTGVRKFMTKDLMAKVNQIETDMASLKTSIADANNEISNERVQRIRWNILDFTNSCRRGTIHTKEEWDHCIDELEWYESYCKDKGIINGVITQSAVWLRNRYKEHLDKDDFLKD